MAFAYHRPQDLDTAAALAAAGGRILAGGQSLMPLVKRGDITVTSVVDINRLPGLDYVTVHGDRIEIGALARLESLRTHPLISQETPLLSAALAWVASPAIRERGTLIGNLVQNGAGAEAVAVAALADVEIVCRTASGTLRTAHLGAVENGDFAVAARLRRSPPGTRAGFYELQRRFGHVCVLGCGVNMAPDNSVGVVFAGLTAAPLVSPTLGAVLADGADDDAAILRAVGIDLAGRPIRSDIHADAEYRRETIPVVVRRALAAARAGRQAA